MNEIKFAIYLTLLLAGLCYGQDGFYLSGMTSPLVGQTGTNLINGNAMASPVGIYGNAMGNTGMATEVSISEAPVRKGLFSKITGFMTGAGGGGLVGWAVQKGLSYGVKHLARTLGYSVGGPFTAVILLAWPLLKPALRPFTDIAKRLFQGIVLTKFQLFQFILGLPRLYHRMLKNVLAQLYLHKVKYNLNPKGLFLALRLFLSGKAFSIPSAPLDGSSGLLYTTESNLAAAAHGKLGRMAYPYASSGVDASSQGSFLRRTLVSSAGKVAYGVSNMGSKLIDTGVNLGTSGMDMYSGMTSGTVTPSEMAMTGAKVYSDATMAASPVVQMGGGYGSNMLNGAVNLGSSLANLVPNVRMNIS